MTSSMYNFQIAGPFLFRVDSGVTVDLENQDWPVRVDDPVFALEYSMQVLGSAKAVAWYSPKHREFMIELRFFETWAVFLYLCLEVLFFSLCFHMV